MLKMKKRIFCSVLALAALCGAAACTDYLKDGSVDLTMPEVPEVPTEYEFNHPTMLHTAADFARVRAKVAAASPTDPVYVSWQQRIANQYAQPSWNPTPQATLV